MNRELREFVGQEVQSFREQGTFRTKHVLQSEQAGRVVLDGKRVVMLGSSNYLGLASDPRVKEAAKRAVDQYGCGAASVSEVCGLTELHYELRRRLAHFLGAEDALLYPSCSTANAGVIDGLTRDGDVILSDQLNHASIIDGCRISTAETKVYPHKDLAVLEENLRNSSDARLRMIVTDGVFSMEGDTAPLDRIVELGERYSAITVVDESHALGVLGERGKGTIEHYGVKGEIDIQTGTFGKALGGAGGGYVCGSQDLADYLYHRSRSFIFTNALPPATIAGALTALRILEEEPSLVQRLRENTQHFRTGIETIGLKLLGGESPITPIMIGEAPKAYAMADRLMEEGVFLGAVGYPVVPRGEARLRVQISAALTQDDLDFSLERIERTARAVGVV
ncbi:MAG TPA: glycine C-acetyltransferase [Anaerolineae bacterium]|nr:glycine C-acetyltransferase [Anaerolineae bacterium]